MINHHFRLGNLSAPLPIPGHDFPVIQYADDTLIILEACPVQVQLVKNLIDEFAGATGLTVNYHKSSLVPINCSQVLIDSLAQLLNCQVGSMPFTYLGLPLGTTKPTIEDLSPIVDNIERRLNACSRFLTYAGRLTYVNSVLSALPTFYMCTLKLQKTIILRADRGRRHCIWAKKEDFTDKVQSLAAWELVCKPKNKGGLGVINLEIQNEALLLKYMDKFMNKLDVPWVDLVWHSYYEGKVPHASPKSGSFWWKDICSLFSKYRGMTTCNVGSGDSILLWKDKWEGSVPLAIQHSRLFSFALEPDISVSSALQTEDLTSLFWLPMSPQAFEEFQSLQDTIASLRLQNRPTTDAWVYSQNNGIYTASSYYQFMFNGLVVGPIFQKLWKSRSLPKLKVFAWLLFVDRLNTRDMLLRRNWHLNSGSECVLCNSNSLEDRDHLFFQCPFAQRYWDKIGVTWVQTGDISQSFDQASRSYNGPCFMEVAVCTAWNIWKERNGLIFEQIQPSFARWKITFKKDILLTSYRLKQSKKEALLAWLQTL